MYWSRRGLSITVAGPDGTTTVQLSKPFARVGSRPGSEIRLSHPGISGQAAYFHATEHDIWCCSMARSGGKPAMLRRIRPGTGVHLGPYRLSADFAQPISSAHDRESSRELAAKSAESLELELESPERDSIVEHRLSSSFAIIGRGLPSTILLDDDRTSRVHCLLYRQGDELWIVDLLSQNGTRRAGKRCEAMLISPGERIGIGSYTLTYSTASSQSRPQDVLPPQPSPMIVEQTIVREQREHIVTRMLTHGGGPIAGEGGFERSAERPTVNSTHMMNKPYPRIEPEQGVHLPCAGDIEPQALLPSDQAIPQPRIGHRAPLAITAPNSSSAALSCQQSNEAEQSPQSQAYSGISSSVKPQAAEELARIERPATATVRRKIAGESDVTQPGNQVLERLIDINTRNAVQSRRRTLVFAAILVGVAALAAVASLIWISVV